MIDVRLIRFERGDQGTFGRLSAPGYSCFVAELPWHNNARDISCIPAGLYDCRLIASPRFGTVYHVADVPGRGNILIHSGNYAGDEARGFRTHSRGCLLPGLHLGRLGAQRAVLASRAALSEFMDAMDGASFTLEIQEHFNV